VIRKLITGTYEGETELFNKFKVLISECKKFWSDNEAIAFLILFSYKILKEFSLHNERIQAERLIANVRKEDNNKSQNMRETQAFKQTFNIDYILYAFSQITCFNKKQTKSELEMNKSLPNTNDKARYIVNRLFNFKKIKGMELVSFSTDGVGVSVQYAKKEFKDRKSKKINKEAENNKENIK
jgi:hypothetical protein